MDWAQLDLNPKVVAAVKRANIQSIKDILCLSGSDLQRLTKLSSSDVQYLHKTVAAVIKSDPVVTALQMYNEECPFPTQNRKLSMGCPVLDLLLGGGIPLMGITEIVGAVYICTEDTFPNKRLQQLIALQSMLRSDVPADIVNDIKFGNNIFIEHVADVESLNHCIGKRLPILLSRGLIRLVVIDSVAALFRCEFGASDSIAKAKCLQKVGAMLHHLSHQFSSPIICVNQIADAISDSHMARSNFGSLSKVLPALGLTWSNQLLMRLMVSRTQLCVEGKFPGDNECTLSSGTVQRRMEIIFAPHLPQSFCNYIICKEGVRGMKEAGI
ncbi:DNA repair protein XRCC3 isoform X2 [Mustelus asterias]